MIFNTNDRYYEITATGEYVSYDTLIERLCEDGEHRCYADSLLEQMVEAGVFREVYGDEYMEMYDGNGGLLSTVYTAEDRKEFGYDT